MISVQALINNANTVQVSSVYTLLKNGNTLFRFTEILHGKLFIINRDYHEAIFEFEIQLDAISYNYNTPPINVLDFDIIKSRMRCLRNSSCHENSQCLLS